MRFLLLPFQALRALLLLITAPLRLLRRRRRPELVYFRLQGPLPFRHRARRGLFRRRSEPAVVASLDLLRRQLDALSRDPRLKGVLFHFEGARLSPAQRAALRVELERLRAAGKRVIAFAVSASNAEYEAMCGADAIWMPPAGRLELNGFAAEATAIGGLLQKLGVRPQFVRRGDYKTAPELFTREGISDIQRATLERLLEQQHAELVARIASGRKISEASARERIDEGPYSARRALAAQLIDALVSEADWLDQLSPRLEAERDELERKDGWRLGSFAAYASTFAFPGSVIERPARRPVVAVVRLEGMIVPGEGGGLPMGPTMAGADAVLKALRSAARDERAKAVVLVIDSPGGSALASELILEEARRTARRKPLVAYFDRVAASGGYMAALGAREIWAGPRAIAGSIGVFGGKFDVSGLFQLVGIHREVLTRGENAALLSAARGFTPHERKCLEADIDDTYEAFLADVAKARGLTRDEAHARAEGRIYSAEEAVSQRLVDRVGDFEAAGRRALELAGVKAERFAVALHGGRAARFPLLSVFTLATRSAIWALSDELLARTTDEWLGPSALNLGAKEPVLS